DVERAGHVHAAGDALFSIEGDGPFAARGNLQLAGTRRPQFVLLLDGDGPLAPLVELVMRLFESRHNLRSGLLGSVEGAAAERAAGATRSGAFPLDPARSGAGERVAAVWLFPPGDEERSARLPGTLARPRQRHEHHVGDSAQRERDRFLRVGALDLAQI